MTELTVPQLQNNHVHIFAKTYAEHEKNVAQYRQILKAQKQAKEKQVASPEQ